MMTFRIRNLGVLIVCAIGFSPLALADTMTSTNYRISWDVNDGGGGLMMSTSYSLTDSVAQPTPIGASLSTSYILKAGFETPPDSDEDQVKNFMDNCTFDPNPTQYDSNGDGFGNLCDPDFDNNGIVNFLDYGPLIDAFLAMPGDSNWNADTDLNGDNVVNFADIALFPIFFLEPPGPSGIAP